MLKFLKLVRYGFWTTCALILMSILSAGSVVKNNQIPSWEDVWQESAATAVHGANFQSAIMKSRDSTVKVHSYGLNFWGGSSTMSGTYFRAKSRHYVITALHGIQGPCLLVTVSHDGFSAGCKEIVKSDSYHDYVIMEIDSPVESARPIKIPDDLPKGTQWKKSYSILNNIIYTGYPNSIGPLTLKGDVVGYSEDEYFYVFSHAYAGSSGSGVFTREGKYIGYIVAIDVGSTDFGPDVLENIVIVAPAVNVDWAVVLTN